MEIGRSMQYSQIGKTLASTFDKTASNTKYADSANKVLWDGFDTIIKSSGTTDDEKALAKLAATISRNTLESVEHNRIAFPFMRAINSAISGPVGAVIAQVSLNAADNVKLANSANKVLWSGFDAIKNNSSSTETEKVLAKMAGDIGANTLESVEHNRISFPIMRSIAGSIGGPIGTVIAQVADKAASNTKLADSANKVLWSGYDTVLNNNSSDAQKALAKLGNTISHHTMESVEHNRIGFTFMRAIANTGADEKQGTLLARVSYDAAHNTKLAASANNVLWDGFQAVLDNPQSTDMQKTIAKEAIDISHNTMNVQEHNRIAFNMMKSIIEA